MRGERDPVVVRTVVPAPPPLAFTLFTEEIDRWWRRAPRYRFLDEPVGTLVLEGHAGGRFLEHPAGGGEPHVAGHVTVWEPPERLVLALAHGVFAADGPTEVEVRFAPRPDGTEVTVTHHGFGPDAPAGLAAKGVRGPALANVRAVWWSDLVSAFRAHVARG